VLFGIATFIGLLTPLKIYSDFAPAMQPLTAINVLSDSSSISMIKLAISETAIKYGIEKSELMQVIECESGFKVKVKGDSGKAYGLLQFHKPTFKGFCKGDYYSPKDQLECAGQMFQTPKLKLHWTCFKKIKL
jgi:hypothetical protein